MPLALQKTCSKKEAVLTGLSSPGTFCALWTPASASPALLLALSPCDTFLIENFIQRKEPSHKVISNSTWLRANLFSRPLKAKSVGTNGDNFGNFKEITSVHASSSFLPQYFSSFSTSENLPLSKAVYFVKTSNDGLTITITILWPCTCRSVGCSGAQYRNTQAVCDQHGNEDASVIQLEALSYSSTPGPAHQELIWSILYLISSTAYFEGAKSSLVATSGSHLHTFMDFSVPLC